MSYTAPQNERKESKMDLSVNFQKAKRNYMTLTFDDPGSDKGVKVIVVGMPKKKVFDALMDMQDVITEREEAQNEKERNGANRRTIEEMYRLTSKILSSNLNGEEISKEWIEEHMDFEDMKELFAQYVQFVKIPTANPN